MPFEEDLSLFLDVDEFASTAVATNINDDEVQFQVIFDNGTANQLDGYAAATSPTALARTADVVNLRQGSPVVIGADTWAITDLQPDGTGLTLLILRKP